MKYRSVQLGLITIAVICIVVLMMTMLYYYKVQQKQEEAINNVASEQRMNIIESILKIKREQAESVLHENSAWDDLLDYIADPSDDEWIYDNIGSMSESYNVANIALFDKNGKLIYDNPTEGNEKIDFFSDIKIPALFRSDYKSTFCIYQGNRLFEYFGSTVVSSNDIITRQEPASGYLIYIREINDSLLNEYSQIMGGTTIGIAHNQRILEEIQEKNADKIFYHIELKNHFGNPVAYMYFTSRNQMKEIFHTFLPMLFVMFTIVLITFVILLFYTYLRINRPLRKIANVFKDEDVIKISNLKSNPTEFGVISNAIITFFNQKNSLQKLYNEVDAKQNELQAQNDTLQEQKNEIENQIENIKVLNQQIMERNKDTERKNVQISVKNQQLEEQSENIRVLRQRVEEIQYNMKFNQKQLEIANSHLLDNQNYASRLRNVLQVALTPTKHVFSDFFLYNNPKEKIGGDFWFAKKVNEWIIAGVGDCNMQGISGAVLSGVDLYLLDDVINRTKPSEMSPNQILDTLNEKIQSTMGEEFVTDVQRDGLHISLLMYNTETHKAFFSAAKRTIVISRYGDITEYFGDNLSIGKIHDDKKFNSVQIQLQPEDTVYMYTDGCTDILGGPYCKKLLAVNLKKEIQRKQIFSLTEQKTQFKNFFENWQGDLEQSDDITMLAFKI